jgi:hypothetical protein
VLNSLTSHRSHPMFGGRTESLTDFLLFLRFLGGLARKFFPLTLVFVRSRPEKARSGVAGMTVLIVLYQRIPLRLQQDKKAVLVAVWGNKH